MGLSYTRQSSAEIVDGNEVEAGPINAEFNALQGAFDGNLGHTHDGTTGEGPKINLTTSITGVLPTANGGISGINKLDATVNPAANNDNSQGYAVGSLWINITSKLVFICVDASGAAAVWTRFQPYGGPLTSIASLTTAANQMLYTTGVDTYATTALTPFSRTLLDDTDASTWLSTLGVSTFVKTILDDTDASTVLSTLGVSTYIKTLLDDADATTARATLGVSIGTQVQAWDQELDALASVTSAANKLPYFTGTGSATTTDLTSAGRALIDDVDTTAQRATLGLGSMALQNSTSVAITGGTLTGTSVTGMTDITIADGGTGASDASGARTNLDVYSKAEVDAGFGAVASVPSSAIMPFARSTAPTGWLECDGSAVSRTTYSVLFGIVSTTYGSGNGTTTFNLPDLRGEFIRGWDHGKGTDSGRALGSSQTDALSSHTHTVIDPGHKHAIGVSYIGSGNSSTGGYAGNGSNLDTTTSGTGITIAATGGIETRPRNFAFMYCIKT